MVEMTREHNGSNVGIGEIWYKDKIYYHGHIVPVLVLKNPLPHLPRIGSEVFQICGEDEHLVSEAASEHLGNVIKAGGQHQWQ